MNKIQTFNNDLFGQIRTTLIEDEPWFVGKDIAIALGYKKPNDAITTHVDIDDSVKHGLIDALGRLQETTFVNESGLYSLIFGSKLPNAKQFKRWVTSEVLPQIRKTGGYIPTSQDDNELTIMAKAHQILERTLQERTNALTETSKALAIAQPKADLYDKFINTKGYFSFNVAAKELGMGRNKLMAILRSKGILFRDGLSNIAYQRYCDSGYFVVKHSIGRNGIPCGVTKVTGRGLDYLGRILQEDPLRLE